MSHEKLTWMMTRLVLPIAVVLTAILGAVFLVRSKPEPQRATPPERGVLVEVVELELEEKRTSLTTFFGLAPMILETSPQARFLVPMAVSLGFGIMFTIIVLGLVPCIYLIADDVKRWFAPPVDVG